MYFCICVCECVKRIMKEINLTRGRDNPMDKTINHIQDYSFLSTLFCMFHIYFCLQPQMLVAE